MLVADGRPLRHVLPWALLNTRKRVETGCRYSTTARVEWTIYNYTEPPLRITQRSRSRWRIVRSDGIIEQNLHLSYRNLS